MCPICQCEIEPKILSQATLGGSTQFDLVECQSCKTCYLSPLPSLEQLQKLYSPQYYGSDWYKQQGLGRAFAEDVLGRRAPGRFLDIGCGLGFFIDGIRKHSGWEVCGIEFAASVVDFAKKELGLDVRQGELSDMHFPDQRFDYVQVRNVLEHVRDPMTLLRECRRILKPDGVLHLLVPNGCVDSLDLINFYRREGKPPYSKSGHVFFFPKRALLRMFEDAGLRVERSWTYGIRRGLASLGLWPRLKDWKRHYIPRVHREVSDSTDIVLLPKKHRPAMYYTYRQLRMNLRKLPGMREFGLDYELLLKPKE